jgi:hypothetical protein
MIRKTRTMIFDGDQSQIDDEMKHEKRNEKKSGEKDDERGKRIARSSDPSVPGLEPRS